MSGASVLLAAALVTVQPAAPPAPAQVPTQTGPAAELAAAERLLETGRADLAVERFRELSRSFPGLADARSGLARALAASGSEAEAARLWRDLGRGWLASGRYRDAVATLETAVAALPDRADLQALLGRSLLLDQAFGRGARHLERAVELGDRSPLTRTYLASAWWEIGQLDRAERELRSILEERPTLAALQQLARLLRWQGRDAEALAVFERIPAAQRGLDLELERATALEGVGRSDEAIALYRRIVEQAPDSSQARYRLARALARRDDDAEAAREMEAYRRLYRADQERTRAAGRDRARLDRGWELLQADRPGEAQRHFASLPATVESLEGLALAARAAGDHGAAAAALERALALDPARTDLRLMLAEERAAAEPRS